MDNLTRTTTKLNLKSPSQLVQEARLHQPQLPQQQPPLQQLQQPPLQQLQQPQIEQPKKKPGRPKKNVNKSSLPKEGIVSKPSQPNYSAELVYDNPRAFRKMCTAWDKLKSETLHFIFYPDAFYVYTQNHNGGVITECVVDVKEMNRYYCESYQEASVKLSGLKLLLTKKINKDCKSIAITLDKKNKNHIDINVVDVWDITAPSRTDLTHDPFTSKTFSLFDKKEIYDIEFSLPSKYFKTLIDDVKTFDCDWTIEKRGGGPLRFKLRSKDGKTHSMPEPPEHVTKPKWNISTKMNFSLSVHTSFVKPISQSQLADEVNFKASQNKSLWIWAQVDKAVVMNMMAEINDLRST